MPSLQSGAIARPDTLTVLFVCTGNVCRTPMAVGFFDDRARRSRIPARAESAGLWRSGERASPHGVAVMAERGLDTSGHRSRVMAPEDLADADLVIGLAREHVREAVVVDRSVFPRAFTLKELVRRAENHRPRRPDEPLAAWLAELHEGRRVQDLLGTDPSDDVADPIGGPVDGYRATAGEIEDLIDRLIAAAWPTGPSGRDRAGTLGEETR